MTPLTKGLIVAALHVAIAASVGAKFLVDRASYPRLWVETAPYDPDLPIRGRYVRIQLRVDAEREDAPKREHGPAAFRARLEVRDGRLVAVEDANGRHWVREGFCDEGGCWLLSQPLAYFIPEHVPDPSRQPAGAALWAEVTLPPTGAPRPVRLGVKRDGPVEPIEF